MFEAATRAGTSLARLPLKVNWCPPRSSIPSCMRHFCPLSFLLLASFVAPLPYSPYGTNSSAILRPPSISHWFGTDSVGADDVLHVQFVPPRPT